MFINSPYGAEYPFIVIENGRDQWLIWDAFSWLIMGLMLFTLWQEKHGEEGIVKLHIIFDGSLYVTLQNLVGGLEHALCFPIYWECHHPN